MRYHGHCYNIDIYLGQVATSQRIRESLKLEETSKIITFNLTPSIPQLNYVSKYHIYTSHRPPGMMTHPNCLSLNSTYLDSGYLCTGAVSSTEVTVDWCESWTLVFQCYITSEIIVMLEIFDMF